MLVHPNIDPVAVQLGPLAIHWYGLMYLFGFAAAWYLGKKRCAQPWSPIKEEQLEDLIFYGALGVILGGRMGYVLFYNFEQFLSDPLWLLRVWEGGMAFHGGLLGAEGGEHQDQNQDGAGCQRLQRHNTTQSANGGGRCRPRVDEKMGEGAQRPQRDRRVPYLVLAGEATR